jgi:serine/threonine-protein kinase
LTEASPSRLGRYEIRATLGRGGMGVVYRGYDALLDREVAIKTYRRDSDMGDEARVRFEQEVRTASRLHHPNVVTVYDGGVEEDIPFIAMELVDGTTLEKELAESRKLTPARAAEVLAGVAAGLDHAHRLGILHRDLKPANILIARDGTPKIVDFGIAKLLELAPGKTTQLLGTPERMSPEQIRNEGLTPRSDVFALGVLAYEVLTGKVPFTGGSMNALFQAVLQVEPPPPSRVDRELPAAVDAAVARALAKDARRRTPDAITLAREIAAALGIGVPASIEERTGGGPADTMKVPAPPSAVSAGRIAAAGAAVLAGGALAVLLMRGDERPQSSPDLPAPTPAMERGSAKRSSREAPRPRALPAKPDRAAAAAPREAPTSTGRSKATELASMHVTSVPPGAVVLIDGRSKATTPAKIDELSPGRHDFEVRKSGFVTYRRSVSLEGGSIYTVDVTLPLEPIPASAPAGEIPLQQPTPQPPSPEPSPAPTAAAVPANPTIEAVPAIEAAPQIATPEPPATAVTPAAVLPASP